MQWPGHGFSCNRDGRCLKCVTARDGLIPCFYSGVLRLGNFGFVMKIWRETPRLKEWGLVFQK